MWRYVLVALATAIVAAAALAYAAPAEKSDAPPGAQTTGELDQAFELIRDCKVRSTLSLHSGAFHLGLEDGSRLDLPASAEQEIYGAIQRATPRCGPVLIAME